MPALATLLTDATRQALGNLGPITGSRGRDNLSEDLIFLLGPRAFSKVTAIVQLKPASVALYLRFSGQKFTDTIPAVLTESINIIHQFLVLKTRRIHGAVRESVSTLMMSGGTITHSLASM